MCVHEVVWRSAGVVLIFATINTLGRCGDDSTNNELSGVVNPENAHRALDARERVFPTASEDGLSKLLVHPHPNVAIRAAWERLERGVRTDNPVENQSFEVSPDRSAIERFVGFVEGRLNVLPPVWWVEMLIGSLYRDAGTHEYWVFHRPADPVYHRTEIGLLAEDGIELHEVDRGTAVVGNGMDFVIPVAVTSDASRRGITEGISACSDGHSNFVALYSSIPHGFRVSRIDAQSDEMNWSARVWVNGENVLFTGNRHCNFVELMRTDRLLYVFGANLHDVYIEAFQIEDGVSEFRFSTGF